MRVSACLDLALLLPALVLELLKPAVASALLPYGGCQQILPHSCPQNLVFVVYLFADSKPADGVAGCLLQAGPLNCFPALPAWL